jgi:hypothetical protein
VSCRGGTLIIQPSLPGHLSVADKMVSRMIIACSWRAHEPFRIPLFLPSPKSPHPTTRGHPELAELAGVCLGHSLAESLDVTHTLPLSECSILDMDGLLPYFSGSYMRLAARMPCSHAARLTQPNRRRAYDAAHHLLLQAIETHLTFCLLHL